MFLLTSKMPACLIAGTTLAFGPVASAGISVFFEDFESGTPGTTVSADSVFEQVSPLPGDPGGIAQYSAVEAAPGGGSQSLILQDSSLVAGNNPEVFWNLNGGDPLDTTKTVKVSYWQRVSSSTVVGQPGHDFDSTQGRVQHVVLTASDANKTRPEGNNGYLAQAWNYTNGPLSAGGTFDYEAGFDDGDALGTFGTGLAVDTWYRVDNYIPLVDMKDGSPAFLGLEDPSSPGEFLGYSNPVRPVAPEDDFKAVFYSRSLSEDLSAVTGQTPYGARRSSNSQIAGGSDGEYLIRALQFFGGGADFMTSFYDDISVEYVTTGDITAVTEAIAAGSTSAEYDYDGSGSVDVADRDYFVRNALQTAYGDTNYDFMVDSNDLDTIALNFNSATSGWENGDFNGDGQVNAADIALVEPFWLNAFSPMVPSGLPDFNDALAAAGIVLSAEILGDYNDNGLVEQGDLNQVLNNWGTDFASVSASWINQRPTEGIVDQAELNVVLNRWGSDSAPDFNGNAVPEPATVALLGTASLMLRRRIK